MRKRPILTLTMNPAVDVSSGVSVLEPFEKLRCEISYENGMAY